MGHHCTLYPIPTMLAFLWNSKPAVETTRQDGIPTILLQPQSHEHSMAYCSFIPASESSAHVMIGQHWLDSNPGPTRLRAHPWMGETYTGFQSMPLVTSNSPIIPHMRDWCMPRVLGTQHPRGWWRVGVEGTWYPVP